MGKTWNFSASGVEVDGSEYPLAALPTREELEGAASEFDAVASAHLSLKRGILAFEGGNAAYRNCFRNVLDLQDGLRDSVLSLEGCYSAIGTFFEVGRSPFGKVKADARMEFAAELLRNIELRVRGIETAKAKDVDEEPGEVEAVAK